MSFNSGNQGTPFSSLGKTQQRNIALIPDRVVPSGQNDFISYQMQD